MKNSSTSIQGDFRKKRAIEIIFKRLRGQMADSLFLPARFHFCVPNRDHRIFRRGKILPRNQLRSRRRFLRFAIYASSLDEPAEEGRRPRRSGYPDYCRYKSRAFESIWRFEKGRRNSVQRTFYHRQQRKNRFKKKSYKR
jgi:hypothetical protein